MAALPRGPGSGAVERQVCARRACLHRSDLVQVVVIAVAQLGTE